MGSLIALALCPVALVGILMRHPAGRRAAPYVLLGVGALLYCWNRSEQGEQLVVSSLVLLAGIVWCMERQGY